MCVIYLAVVVFLEPSYDLLMIMVSCEVIEHLICLSYSTQS